MKKKCPPDLIDKCRKLRRELTDVEKLMWRMLRNRQLAGAKFRRQHLVGPYILDFYCHEAQLAIELDGGQHAETNHILYDSERTIFLSEKGIRVLRFWNKDVLFHTESVLETIWNALTPTLSQGKREY